MKSIPKICALHGFLGQPKDWDILSFEGMQAINLFENIYSSKGLKQCAQQINKSLQKDDSQVLMGYSLGGRLALHMLLDNPSRWNGAVIISANPGFPTVEAQQERLKQDDYWAQRFIQDPWEELMLDWHSQDLFKGTCSISQRKESEFDRQVLASVLRNWSAGHQEDLSTRLEKLDMPILWIAGERDQRFKKYAGSVKLKHPLSSVWIAPEAGHRTPWDRPQEFKHQVNKFINLL